jgi:hypothetical protein
MHRLFAIYMTCFLSLQVSGAIAQTPTPVHFIFTDNTGSNATVALTTNSQPQIFGQPLENGDEVGAFTLAGLCAGALVWQGVNTAMAIWADNEQTPSVDGFEANEPMAFRIWDASADKEYSALATFALGPESFQANGISILASLSATQPLSVERSLILEDGANMVLYQNCPNPANPGTTFRFYLSKPEKIVMTLYNNRGEQVRTLASGRMNAGTQAVFWDGTDHRGKALPSGPYHYILTAGERVESRHLILAR